MNLSGSTSFTIIFIGQYDKQFGVCGNLKIYLKNNTKNVLIIGRSRPLDKISSYVLDHCPWSRVLS